MLPLDVVLQKALGGLERGRSEFHLGVVLHPDLQPCSHCVGLGPPIVDADVFLDCLFQLFLDFCLCLAENILDDGLPGFWIVTDCVASFPSSVLSFSDIALAVCSSFWHGISLLCNGKPYRKQQRKATGKRNCYQKVIICAGCPIFVYGDAIFALPGAFSLVGTK